MPPSIDAITRKVVSRDARLSVPGNSQHTLAQEAVVEGFGYWSGRDVRVEFRPAAPDTGVVFVRDDLQPAVRIPASLESRIETPLRTTLTASGVTVEMVEHVLAALYGLGIDNCEVHVDAAEMPGCDGSSAPFVVVLLAAGRVAQATPREQLVVQENVRVGNEESWIEARPARGGEFSLRYRLDYPDNPAIGRQTVQMEVSEERFVEQLAPARTFMLQAEAEWLLSQGKGTRVSKSDVLVFDEDGPVENELRFDDECARHKMLDILGDISLTGCRFVGQIIAHRSGHRLNAELARALMKEFQVTTPALRRA
ncbi:MAG: UDP-3-O-[3-hydroxymyristoyl] N-acetylglucosamine deacetylase [Planctomycetota bacterium]|nr:MAG: UDP-3-O-[3-hydroxymyristoyl] N-acetylglucosamine deacetylase [Planctomycetota bacterium]REJ94645.1 MAG: UDP-3-O-[3-hydroxymyristoyl] N-acetylglucosamine deacetylase [Planctomycetota bacterium]REK21703.1 MAG: UDP-3-O-[3-hydroxymyristoyl] N-acetylglucosamine deacetylase [Planctomycetota bacterium]REK43109.1 MAG: UDP-3-O-[3-hydroxymyristoyl] N-acetylglucosamine deacetylase [Planctomycetota bacterium]